MAKISNLFRWSRTVDIKDGSKILATVYMRLVGDVDYQEARNVALKASKRLRVALRNKDSEEYKANLLDSMALTREEKLIGVNIYEMGDYRDEALMVTPEKAPPELPDNPTLEDQEKHQDALDKARTERAQALTDFMDKRSVARREEVSKLSGAEINDIYETALINAKCTEEFGRVFREYQVFRGTFDNKDFTTPSFSSYQEFTDSSLILKNQLTSAYIGLEISGEELKN